MNARLDLHADEPPAPTPAAQDPALARVLARVRLRARRRCEWLRVCWRDEPAGAATRFVSHAEADLHLDDRDSPEAEAAWQLRRSEPADADASAALDAAIAADVDSRLARLCRMFGLEAVERDLLHACLAAALDPALLRLFAYLQDDASRTCVTDSLVARLFQRARTLVLDPESPILRWCIVTAVPSPVAEERVYVLDRAVRDWLLGHDVLDPELVGLARVQPIVAPLPAWPVDETAARVRRWLVGPAPSAVRVLVAGAPGSGRRSFAAAVAGELGLSLLAIDVRAVDDAAWPRVHLKAQRQAFLDTRGLVFHGADSPRPAPETVTPFPLQFVTGDRPRPTPTTHQVDHIVELPPPDLAARRALWAHHLPWTREWPAPTREALIAQHRTLPADLARVGRRGPDDPEATAACLRASSCAAFDDLAQRLDCTFHRADLILPPALDAALDALLFEARDRVAFWEDPRALRVFPQGRGLLALFSGPPGTGKTMSAQVIAAALGVDLFRIDLAAIVSKWVGETSRNLDRLLARAARLDAVLLFDEADALFGKRTEVKEANDRFANTDTAYLLQAIESYRGIAVLASNRKADVDPAFLRRLRHVLDFPAPDADARGRLWRSIVAALTTPDHELVRHPDLDLLAAFVEATGAQIKYAVLNAVFAARREARSLTVRHLARGLEQELAKEGRSLGERARERLGLHAG